jgi:hypothetical protein
MKFYITNPINEDNILVLCSNGEFEYIVQGQWYIDEGDFYDCGGELLSCAIAWAEMPEIEKV